MKSRFPLWLKILVWFFLNVVFLVAVFAIMASAQFHFGWDALISGPAGDHIQDVTRLLVTEVSVHPRNEWNDVLKSAGEEHGVKFYLFHFGPGVMDQLAGEPIDLPAEVRARIQDRGTPNPQPFPGPNGGPGLDDNGGPMFAPGRQGGPPPRMGGPGAPGGFNGPGGRRGGRGGGGPPQSLVHAAGRYWVVAHVNPPFRQQLAAGTMIPMPAAVVMASETLSAGGLFFDPMPWLVAGVGVILISTLFWLPLVRGITRSLSRMTRATERIAEGQFDVRTEVNRNDELGSLSEAINRMAVRLAGLVTGQKRFLGDIAHELCSPIARMQLALGILENTADAKQKERLADLREEVEQMSNLVNELLSFSRASIGKTSPRLQSVALRETVERAVARECGADAGTTVNLDVPGELRAIAEPELLLRALANVLRNAVRYAGASGPIAVRAARDGDRVMLSIEDSGPGVPEEALPKLFDPFYRVDTSRTRDTGGVGLGLSIVKTCIESCGGTVSCENRQPSGLRVIFRLGLVS